MSLSFSSTAAGPIVAPYVALEPKVCECCRGSFYRPVQAARSPGPRYCLRCKDHLPESTTTGGARMTTKRDQFAPRIPLVPYHMRLMRWKPTKERVQ